MTKATDRRTSGTKGDAKLTERGGTLDQPKGAGQATSRGGGPDKAKGANDYVKGGGPDKAKDARAEPGKTAPGRTSRKKKTDDVPVER
jgi:hypothetical protein